MTPILGIFHFVCICMCYTLVASWHVYIESLLEKCLTFRLPGSYLEKMETCYVVKSGNSHCKTVIHPQLSHSNIVKNTHICGWMVPNILQTKHYYMRYDVISHASFVVQINFHFFKLEYSPMCQAQRAELQSCDQSDRTAIYCGNRSPWIHASGNNSITLQISGIFYQTYKILRASYEIIDKQMAWCFPIRLLNLNKNLREIRLFIMNDILTTAAKSLLRHRRVYQVRTAPYNRILFVAKHDRFYDAFSFHDGPGIKAPLVDLSGSDAEKIVTSTFQLFISEKQGGNFRQNMVLSIEYNAEMLPTAIAGDGCRMRQSLSPHLLIHVGGALPAPQSYLCALYVPPHPLKDDMMAAYNLTINYFTFSGDDVKYADQHELCPLGGMYIYRYKGVNTSDITLVHDGCHIGEKYKLNLVIDYFYIIHVAYPGYSSLEFSVTITTVHCQVLLNPCLVDVSQISMAPQMCVSILETPIYSPPGHVIPQRCSYNLSDAITMTGSATLSVLFLYPNHKVPPCAANNSTCGLYTHKVYISSDWPEKVMDSYRVLKYTGGDSSIIMNHFITMNFADVSYVQTQTLYRIALLNVYLKKVSPCTYAPEKHVQRHIIRAGLRITAPCSLSHNLPAKFNTITIRLQNILNKTIIANSVFKTHTDYLLSTPDVKVYPLSVSLYYDECFHMCVNDTVIMTEVDRSTSSILQQTWRPVFNSSIWMFQNLISFSGFKLEIIRRKAWRCGFKSRCQPYIILHKVYSPLKSINNHDSKDHGHMYREGHFVIYPNR